MDDEGSVESDDRFGDLEDDFDVEEVGGEEESPSMGKDSVVQVDAEKLVKDIVAALTKSLGDVVKLKDYSPLDDLDMEDEDEDLGMEDEDFDMEDEDEDLEGPELKESVVSELLSRKIAQSVFESLKKKGVVKKKSKKDEKPVKMSKKGSSNSDRSKDKKELDDSYIMRKRKFGLGDLEEAKDKGLHTDDREQIERSRKPYTRDERHAAYDSAIANDRGLTGTGADYGSDLVSAEGAGLGRVSTEAQRQKYVNEFLKKEPEDQKKDLKAIYLCSVNADHRFQLPNDLKNLCAEKRNKYKEWKMGDFKLILKKMKTAAERGKTKLPVENIARELSKATKSFEKKTY
jgi:hypothetical protein